MPKFQPTQVSGYLLQWPEGETPDISICQTLTEGQPVFGGQWTQYTYTCRQPFRHEEPGGMYSYPVYLKLSEKRRRFVLLSVNHEIVEHLVNEDLRNSFPSAPERVPIAVDRFVRSLKEGKASYLLTFAHARVESYGQQLRSQSYWGDDLLEADLFRDNIAKLVFLSCGIRLPASSSTQILRVGAEGSLSHLSFDARNLQEALRFLSFLQQKGFVAAD